MCYAGNIAGGRGHMLNSMTTASTLISCYEHGFVVSFFCVQALEYRLDVMAIVKESRADRMAATVGKACGAPVRDALFLSFLSFRKKRVRPLFSILQENHSFENTMVLKTAKLVRAKHRSLFHTVVFLKTVVFSEYFKKTEVPNGA